MNIELKVLIDSLIYWNDAFKTANNKQHPITYELTDVFILKKASFFQRVRVKMK